MFFKMYLTKGTVYYPYFSFENATHRLWLALIYLWSSFIWPSNIYNWKASYKTLLFFWNSTFHFRTFYTCARTLYKPIPTPLFPYFRALDLLFTRFLLTSFDDFLHFFLQLLKPAIGFRFLHKVSELTSSLKNWG